MGEFVSNGGLVVDGLLSGVKTFLYAHHGQDNIDDREELTDLEVQGLVTASATQAAFDTAAAAVASWYAGHSTSMKSVVRRGVAEFGRVAATLC